MNGAPETIKITVDTVSQLTQLVAAHGVYALVILFMFFLQRRARLNLRDATTERDRTYYRREHSWTTAAVFILSGVASVVWIYQTFHTDRIFIQGSLKDLANRAIAPQKASDPPWLVHSVLPFRNEVSFYSSAKNPTEAANFDLDWVVLAKPGMKQLLLRFQQHAQVLVQEATAKTAAQHQTHLVTGHATIDLDLTRALDGEYIQLVYQPHSLRPLEELGMILIEIEGELRPIPWVSTPPLSISPEVSASASAPSWVASAWASPLLPSQTRVPPGNLASPEFFSRSLMSQLGSTDLQQQLAAQRTLLEVHQESRSLAFIESVVTDGDNTYHLNAFALQNIAAILDELSRRGYEFSSHTHATLGNRLYDLGDHAAALPLLEKSRGTSSDSRQTRVRRAISYYNVGDSPQAIVELTQLLSTTSTSKAESTVRSNLGAAYAQLNRLDEAENEYARALELYPRNGQARTNLGFLYLRRQQADRAEAVFSEVLGSDPRRISALVGLGLAAHRRKDFVQARQSLERALELEPSNPTVLNNLAYAFAESGEQLDLALQYVERAIDHGGERAEYLDTKAWILHKLHRSIEAKVLLEKAILMKPEDAVIREHYDAVNASG